jgi:hypothetical protein
VRPYLLVVAIVIIGGVLGIIPWTVDVALAQYSSDGNGLGNNPMAPAAPISPGYRERSPVPGPPAEPTAPSTPGTWPGQGQPASPPTGSAQLPSPEKLNSCYAAMLARVGLEPILESDVVPYVEEMMAEHKDSIPPEQWDITRTHLIKQKLRNCIEIKLIYLDAKHTVPAEHWPNLENQVDKQFEDAEVEKMMKKYKAATRHELDVKLRAKGTSIEKEKRLFREQTIAGGWLHEKVKRDDEVTYEQMVAYYRDHQAEFAKPARAMWEELMIRVSKWPNPQAAEAAIAWMGNQVAGGASFAEMAKAHSDGPTADDGGRRNWTTKGSLVCEDLDRALFSLPLGRLSPTIIKGPDSLHIIRVIKREDATVKPFLEAQVDIRSKIVKERWEKESHKFLAHLEALTPVGTIFDNEGPNPWIAAPPDRQPERR